MLLNSTCTFNNIFRCTTTFKPVANQAGLLAFIGGKPVGLDLVSLTSAYAKLHPKLVRSYALEALLVAAPPPPVQGSTFDGSGFKVPYSDLARAFLLDIAAAEERQFPSVGHGTDFRYRSTPRPSPPAPPAPSRPISASQLSAFQHFSLCGTALVHENEVIHAAFFRLDGPSTLNPQPSTSVAPLRNRRRHYRE